MKQKKVILCNNLTEKYHTVLYHFNFYVSSNFRSIRHLLVVRQLLNEAQYLLAVLDSSCPHNDWSGVHSYAFLKVKTISAMPKWSHQCQNDLINAKMISSMPKWSQQCQNDLSNAKMISAMPKWSQQCQNDLSNTKITSMYIIIFLFTVRI